MKKETYQLLCRSVVVVGLTFGASFTLQAKRNSGQNSSGEMRERGGRREPSPEIKAALKECAGGKKREEMTEADREKARACMEAKGLPPPPRKGEGEGRRKNDREDGEREGRKGDRKKPPRGDDGDEDRPDAPPPENDGSGDE